MSNLRQVDLAYLKVAYSDIQAADVVLMRVCPNNVVKPFNALLFKVVYYQSTVIIVTSVNQNVLAG